MMPETQGVVKAKSKYGIILDGREEWWNWTKDEMRGEPFEKDTVKKGDAVRLTYAESDKGGVFISVLEIVGAAQDVTPDGSSSPSAGGDGQFRTPTDFKRTSALAQAVAFYAGVPDAQVDAVRVIETARKYEKYLNEG